MQIGGVGGRGSIIRMQGVQGFAVLARFGVRRSSSYWCQRGSGGNEFTHHYRGIHGD